MGISYKDAYSPDGIGLNLFDRVIVGTYTAVYPSGASAGATSTIACTWTEPVITPYCAVMSPIEDCTYFITSRTVTGFTLNVNPRLATNTLTGGSVEILIQS